MKNFYLWLCLSLLSLTSFGQQTNERVLVSVIGSSTAAGTGPTDPNNAFANRLRTYLKAINPNSDVFNVASGGLTSYHCNPTWYVPPANRPAVNASASITRAIAGPGAPNNFKPDYIIVSLPTNDAISDIPLAETKANFERIWAAADSLHIPVLVATAQPRNDGNAGQVQLLVDLKTWVLTRFGVKALDFWTDIAGTDNLIKPIFRAASGDLIHLNDSAHGIFFNRIVAKNILDTIGKGPVRFASFAVSAGKVVSWTSHRERYMKHYILQRSLDSLNWTSTDTVLANGSTITSHSYSRTDNIVTSNTTFYRLVMEDVMGRKFYTAGIKHVPSGQVLPTVELEYFNASISADTITVNWKAAVERNLKHYKLLVNFNGTGLSEATTQLPLASKTYQYVHYQRQNTIYQYRLAIESNDGRKDTTPVITVYPDSSYWQPVVLATGLAVSAQGVLTWSTSVERKLKYFILEKSTDSVNFTFVANVNAVGNSHSVQPYSYTVSPVPTTVTYYRLKAKDFFYREQHIYTVRFTPPSGPPPSFNLTYFTAFRVGTHQVLNWETTGEHRSWEFFIEYSLDSTNWNYLGERYAAGHATSLRQYTYTDFVSRPTVLYYRLNMLDSNGIFKKSPGFKLGAPVPDTINKTPFVIASFTATRGANNQVLNWQTSNEYRAWEFFIEHSADSINWSYVGERYAFGNSSTLRSYTYTDFTFRPGVVYYRLNMLDSTGTFYKSKGVKLLSTLGRQASTLGVVTPVPDNVNLAVYPNPATNSFRFLGLPVGEHHVKVFNVSGAVVYENKNYQNTEVIVRQLPAGIYFIHVDNGVYRLRLVKQ